MSRADRTERILSRVVPSIIRHQNNIREKGQQQRPFILALTGLQGCGKSTLATDIVNTLNEKHKCRSIEVSLDDFYLTHDEREELQKSGNTLLRVRGQPGTHDCKLASKTLSQFNGDRGNMGKDVILPIFDKSLFHGDGDRLPETQWRVQKQEPPIQVLVFEGWCVGFQPLSDTDVEAKWKQAKAERDAQQGNEKGAKSEIEQEFSTTTLANHRLEELLQVNANLEKYCEDFIGPQHFDLLIHLDTGDLANVYRWRMEQEHMMKEIKGNGMTDNQVVAFVQGYMPAYELYLDQLRGGFFRHVNLTIELRKEQVHVLLDKSRQLIDIQCIN